MSIISKDFTQGLLVGAGGAVAVCIGYYFGFHPKPAIQHKKVFVLAVRLKLNPAKGGLKAFIEGFTPLAQFCNTNEPNTLSYELCKGEEDENEIIIYERYVTKDDLTQTHHSSAIFKAFGASLGPGGKYEGLVLEKSRASYTETNLGFMSK